MSEIIKYRGRDIKIHRDDCAESPRTAWDSVGTMVCWHNRCNLGDDPIHSDVRRWLEYLALNHVIFCDADDIPQENLWKVVHKHYLVMPLFLYDHSGITMSCNPFTCPWDSGQVGYIYCSKESAVHEWGKKNFTKKVREKAESYLKGEVEVYDQYLRGEVYFYNAVGDSCGGFYGSDHKASGLLEYAENAIDCYILDVRNAFFERKKVELRNHIPLHLRTSYATT